MAEKKTAREQLGVDLPEPEEPQVVVAEAPVEEPTEPERPEWLPENYKTPEDLAAAHRSLQDRLRQEAEDRKQREQENAELRAALEQQQQAQQQGQQGDLLDNIAAEIAYARETGDVRRELELNAWLQQQTLQQSLGGMQVAAQQQERPGAEAQDQLIAAHVHDSMQRQFDDWEELKPQVAELLTAEPWRLPDQALDSIPSMQSALASVYEVVKARQLLEQQKELEQRGLGQADLSRARKLEAQTMQGASGRPDEPSQVDREIAEMNSRSTRIKLGRIRQGS
jgi:hypothetical protein